MKSFILFITNFVNSIHDFIMNTANGAGFNVTDKDLHLWVFGIIGLFIFIAVHFCFKILSEISITAISFIYTLTVILVLIFAVEIEQKITGRGQMEFDDAVMGLWGFLLFFAAFLILKGIFVLIKKLFKK
jgi:hypothetical protein